MAVTLYEPSGRFSNRYAPLASVVVVVTDAPKMSRTALPSALVIVSVTPAIPGSPASCTPSRSVSAHTKLPTLTFGTIGTLKNPMSNVWSFPPGINCGTDTVGQLDTSVALLSTAVDCESAVEVRVAGERT